MPTTETLLRELRHRYNAAFAAYQNCAKALNEAAMSGTSPLPELLANEAKALHGLTDARAKLLAALAETEKEEHTVLVSRREGIMVEIRREPSGGAQLTVDLGCCKTSRKISWELAKEHAASPQFDRIVQEMEAELLPTCGPRPQPRPYG